MFGLPADVWSPSSAPVWPVSRALEFLKECPPFFHTNVFSPALLRSVHRFAVMFRSGTSENKMFPLASTTAERLLREGHTCAGVAVER